MSSDINRYEPSGSLRRNKRVSGHQLSRLHTFEAAARHCSFALAAQELALTPGAVSHRINTLESELGFRLFERFHRRVELTSDGERIYWALRKNLDDINQEIIDIKNQEISGELTVYSRPSLAQCWLIPGIADFTDQYPAIQLNLLTGNDDVNFRGYGIDIAIYYDDISRPNLYCEDLMSESIVPVCSRNMRNVMSCITIFISSGTACYYMTARHGAVTRITTNGKPGVNTISLIYSLTGAICVLIVQIWRLWPR